MRRPKTKSSRGEREMIRKNHASCDSEGELHERVSFYSDESSAECTLRESNSSRYRKQTWQVPLDQIGRRAGDVKIAYLYTPFSYRRSGWLLCRASIQPRRRFYLQTNWHLILPPDTSHREIIHWEMIRKFDFSLLIFWWFVPCFTTHAGCCRARLAIYISVKSIQ